MELGRLRRAVRAQSNMRKVEHAIILRRRPLPPAEAIGANVQGGPCPGGGKVSHVRTRTRTPFLSRSRGLEKGIPPAVSAQNPYTSSTERTCPEVIMHACHGGVCGVRRYEGESNTRCIVPCPSAGTWLDATVGVLPAARCKPCEVGQYVPFPPISCSIAHACPPRAGCFKFVCPAASVMLSLPFAMRAAKHACQWAWLTTES